MVLIRGTRCSELCNGVMSSVELGTLNESRAKNSHCDAVLRTEDGGSFPVHRTVLMIHSDFFRALFTTWLPDREQTDFLMHTVKSDAVTQILDYAYTGQVDINRYNVCDLFVASDYLSVVCLREVCSDFLKQTLDVETCIGYMRFARSYFVTELESAARHFVLRRFVQVSQCSEELLELPVEELLAILGDEQLNVSNEEDVWNCALRWIDRDTENRKVHVVDLMKTVRLGLLDKNFFRKKVKNHAYVKGNPTCRPKVLETLRFFKDVQMMTKKGREFLTPEFARPRIPLDILFAIGGDEGNHMDFIEAYDVRADRWTKVEEVNPVVRRESHGTAVIGFNIYIIGGRQNGVCLKSCHCFNAVSKTWREVAPMHCVRSSVSAVGLGEMVYAIGGSDGHHDLTTAERYNCKTNQWSLLAPMNFKRKCTRATVLNGKIYVTGGEYSDIYVNSAEMYDPETDQWTLITRMLSARSGHSCIAFDGCVYAIGGSGRLDVRCGERYDPRTKKWTDIPRMRSRRRRFATAVIDDKIFAIGGFNGNKTIRTVESFNNRANQWTKAKSMNCARADLSACVVKGLPNARDYAYKNREMLMEEKRQILMARKMGRKGKEQEKQEDSSTESDSDDSSSFLHDPCSCVTSRFSLAVLTELLLCFLDFI